MNLDINPEDVLVWETKKLWNVVKKITHDAEGTISEQDIASIKMGITMDVPIWYITEEWYEIYPASKKVKVQGFGKFQLVDFMQEKELRDNLMRNIILENIDENGIVTGRSA
jgi:hypothetical protein